jgi:ubiquinone/menaquinone biosynthesis C-methylase UbiE
MPLEFPWPVPPGFSQSPVWTGGGFRIGDLVVPVLAYETGASGWSDSLTSFHEQHAGPDHFIDRASRQHALEQLDRHLRVASPVILEIGCSSGFMLRSVREHLPNAFLIGSDYVRGPLEKLAAEMTDLPLLQFDLVHCPLPDNCVDAVILLNVLEHIQDDVTAARQIHRILKPGGVAVIEVPAGPRLYDVYDKLLLHCRRYSLKDLKRLVEGAGFLTVDQSHLGCFMYPGFWAVKQRNKRFLSRQGAEPGHVVARNIHETGASRVLGAVMRWELTLGRWISYPFGIRCLLTCVKV